MARRPRKPLSRKARPKKTGTRASKRGGGRVTKAQRIKAERRKIGSNPNYVYWIAGYQSREAERTGKVPSVAGVTRDKNFRKWVDVVLGHDPKRKHGPNSQLAKALVELGIRDPTFRGAVGNSPGRGERARHRGTRDRRGLRRGSHHP